MSKKRPRLWYIYPAKGLLYIIGRGFCLLYMTGSPELLTSREPQQDISKVPTSFFLFIRFHRGIVIAKMIIYEKKLRAENADDSGYATMQCSSKCPRLCSGWNILQYNIHR